MAGLLSVTYFLAYLFFSLILLLFWLRMFLRYHRVSVVHPISQLVYQLTGPLTRPLEAIFYKKYLPRYDWVCFFYIILIETLKVLIFSLLLYKIILPLPYLPLFIVAALIIDPCDLLFYALLIRVILSWLNPSWQQHPAADILKIITNPLIRIGHRIIPNISGFDFGPFVMMIVLKVITLFISSSLPLAIL